MCTSENSVPANFGEFFECELPRIPKRRSSQKSYSTHFGE
jgi:hypothetical protein